MGFGQNKEIKRSAENDKNNEGYKIKSKIASFYGLKDKINGDKINGGMNRIKRMPRAFAIAYAILSSLSYINGLNYLAKSNMDIAFYNSIAGINLNTRTTNYEEMARKIKEIRADFLTNSIEMKLLNNMNRQFKEGEKINLDIDITADKDLYIMAALIVIGGGRMALIVNKEEENNLTIRISFTISKGLIKEINGLKVLYLKLIVSGVDKELLAKKSTNEKIDNENIDKEDVLIKVFNLAIPLA